MVQKRRTMRTGDAGHADARALQRLQARLLQHGTQALYESGPLFDQLYRRRKQDVRFYVEDAQRYGGPVLELGVGTGRVALPWRSGIDVRRRRRDAEHARACARAPAHACARGRGRASCCARGDMRSVRLGRRSRW